MRIETLLKLTLVLWIGACLTFLISAVVVVIIAMGRVFGVW